MSPRYHVKCKNFSSSSFFSHVLSTNPQYERVAEAYCCNMGWILAQRGGRCSWSVAKKDWKHVSVQKVVTLNICCDVACLTFHLPHTTTGSFQSYQWQPTSGFFSEPPTFGVMQHTFSQMKKLCILQGSVVTFFRCGG